MADGTKIEWTDATVNAVNGCSVVSPGCKHCYAMKQAHRFPVRAGLTQKTAGGMVWTGEVRLNEKALLQPLAWRRSRRIFWNAHGDLFHPNVPDEWIDKVFAVCALTPQHEHQILTKRPERMRAYLTAPGVAERIYSLVNELAGRREVLDPAVSAANPACWPLPNVWLGTSVEDQQRADERIPELLATPAAVRFLSCEPLLGPVDLSSLPVRDKPLLRCDALYGVAECGGLSVDCPKLDWIIVGGESGSGARPMHPDWARSLRDQCAAAGVPFFFKQWGEAGPLRPDLIPVPRRDIGWVARDGRFKFGCTEDEHGPMYDDDDRFGPGFWSQTVRVGKKAAGRLLDGVEHSAMPNTGASA